MDPRRSRPRWPCLLSLLSLLAIACGSPTVSNVAKTNVNAVNKVPYSQTENAYRLAQRDVDLAPLENMVGKTASEIKLWEHEVVTQRLKALLGSEYARMLKFWNSETPLKKFGDILMLSGCDRDNCANNRYVIFISVSESFISVVHIGKTAVREWKTRGRIDLPPPFLEELDAMKKLD